MSVVNFFSPVSLFLWYTYFVNGIHSTKGLDVTCGPISCSSKDYELENCVLDEDARIVNASVATSLSRTNCVNAQDYQSDDNSDIGFYGYNDNIFWVDKGCSAKFKICYIEGQSIICEYFSCSSEEYKFQKCLLDEEIRILNVTVDDILSRTICVNYQDYLNDENEDIGFYGYDDNILWVDKSCSAEFEICYTESSVFCNQLPCGSEDYREATCWLEENSRILNATVDTLFSKTDCFQIGTLSNYGYNENLFWVDDGCSAMFTICHKGPSILCGVMPCSSEEHEEAICVLNENVRILNATVDTILSDIECLPVQEYDDGYDLPDGESGVYGYRENVLWADNGCRAMFRICYTVDSPPDLTPSTSSISTAETSSPPTTFSEILTTENDIDPMSTSAIETTRETSTPTTEFYGTHSQTERHQQQDTSDTTNVIIVVAVVAGVLVLGIIGIILCRIRYKRKRTIRKENDTVFEKRTETVPPKIHGFKNQKCHQTPTAKTTNEMSAEIKGQLNMYTSLLSEKTLLRQETNENTKPGENERPIPAKRHISKDNAIKALGTKPNKANIQAPTNKPAGITDTEVGNEQVEQSDDYLEPVSNRTSLEESANYIELQPEAQVETSPNTAVESGNAVYTADEEYHVYDYIDPNKVPDTFS